MQKQRKLTETSLRILTCGLSKDEQTNTIKRLSSDELESNLPEKEEWISKWHMSHRAEIRVLGKEISQK